MEVYHESRFSSSRLRLARPCFLLTSCYLKSFYLVKETSSETFCRNVWIYYNRTSFSQLLTMPWLVTAMTSESSRKWWFYTSLSKMLFFSENKLGSFRCWASICKVEIILEMIRKRRSSSEFRTLSDIWGSFSAKIVIGIYPWIIFAKSSITAVW